MITALSVETPDKGKGIFKLINSLRRDKVTVEFSKARGVCLKNITYRTYSGKIRLENLDSVTGCQKNRLLCSEKLDFPANSGYKRFYSPEFSARLCTNMALDVLKNCKNSEKLKIGIYDPKAVASDFLFYALDFCSDIAVVTYESDIYYCQLNRAMEELGASAVVTNQLSELAECDFVVAPSVICENLPVKSDALVLTVERPKVPTAGLVYYKYTLRMPNGFDKLRPDELDEEYFCSALYTLERQYELGSIVPTLCMNSSSSQTVKSICAYMRTIHTL